MSTFYSKLLTRMAPSADAVDPAYTRDARDAFAMQVKSVLETLGIATTYDPVAFSLDAGNNIAWLRTRFDAYRSAPEAQREGIVLEVARGILETQRPSPVASDLALARPNLRPRICQRANLVIAGLQIEADGLDPGAILSMFLPISTDLGAEVVYDTPQHIVSLSDDPLRSWGITSAEALTIAIENLRKTAPRPFRRANDGVWLSAVGDCYDSSRILLADEIAALPLQGPPVALPINRDTLVITGAHNTGGLYRLLQLAMAMLPRERVDTLQAVALEGSVWRDWLPPPDHPMYEAFYELATRNRGIHYAEIKQLLTARHQRQGIELFISSYGLFRPSDGSPPRSHALWPPVQGLLPETDLVSLVHPDDARYIVLPRPILLEAAGHLLQRVADLHPPYDAFEGVPEASIWERLRRHAVREGVLRAP